MYSFLYFDSNKIDNNKKHQIDQNPRREWFFMVWHVIRNKANNKTNSWKNQN